MKKKSSREMVISICELLKSKYQNMSDAEIQDFAINIHDIEKGCFRIAEEIKRFKEKKAISNEEIDQFWCFLEVELFEHLVDGHVKSLKKKIKNVRL